MPTAGKTQANLAMQPARESVKETYSRAPLLLTTSRGQPESTNPCKSCNTSFMGDCGVTFLARIIRSGLPKRKQCAL
eukprot:15166334-Heterocapsa_arctica.AAC.1